MTAILEARGLGKQYRSRWALTDCNLSIPPGHVVGLVGPNGAGKTTLLSLAAGMLTPTVGTIEVAGAAPGTSQGQLARVGFVAQDTPVYAALSVADHLRLGARLNPSWDDQYARGRISKLGLDPRQKAGRLSGGQRAQLALTLAIAKRPELLILDEPIASLDPLARRNFLSDLAEAAKGHRMSVVLSSHLVADLERACDYLIVLTAARVQIAGEVSQLLASHRMLTGPRAGPAALPTGWRIIHQTRSGPDVTVVARAGDTPLNDPAWTLEPLDLEDLVLAYLSQAADTADRDPELEATR